MSAKVRLTGIAVLLGLLPCFTGPSQAAASVESLYREAYSTEIAERDPEKAIGQYQAVIHLDSPKGLYGIQAQFRIGLCAEKLEKIESAIAAFDAVIVQASTAPPDLLQTARRHRQTLLDEQARLHPPVPPSAPPAGAMVYQPVGLEISLLSGVAVPVLNKTYESGINPSAVLAGSVFYGLTPWVHVGAEVGYSFGHTLKIEDNPLNAPGSQPRLTLKVLQATSQIQVGHWTRFRGHEVRPYLTLGGGLYAMNQQAVYDQDPAFLLTVSNMVSYGGINTGAGFLYKLNRLISIGPDIRYHQVFASGNDFHALNALLRLSLSL